MRPGRHLSMKPQRPRLRWGLTLLVLHILVLFITAAPYRKLSRKQGAPAIKADDACLRLQHRYRKEHGVHWTADLDTRLQELCKGATRVTASGHRVLNTAKVDQAISKLAPSLSGAPVADSSSVTAAAAGATPSAGGSDSGNPEWGAGSGKSRADANTEIQIGSCLGLKAKALSTQVAIGSQFKLKFTINNPVSSRTAADYTYVLRVDVPSGVNYVTAKVFPTIKNMRFQPTVGGGMLLWEITPIPASMAKIGVTLEFAVDGCLNSSTPLRFTALGVQIVNGAPLCPVQPVIPEIGVYQDPKKPNQGCASSSSLTASITAVRAPAFNAYGPAGTRCIETGTPSNLPSPTLDECFAHCSFLLPQEPSYMNYLDGANGQPRCSCLGGTCTLGLIAASGGATSRQRSRNLKRAMAMHREDGISASKVDAAVDMDIRNLEEARFGAYQITSLATREPTAAPTVTPTLAPTANCFIPATFLANFEYCEPKLCPNFLWRIKHLNTSDSDIADPTAYDVCRSACSYLTLGEPGNAETHDMRKRCQARCRDDGYESFACQAYCTDYPDDPACPRPGCTTLASVEANLEYCSQNICDALFPVVDPPLSGQNVTTYDVCRQACSAQQLGPEGTLETADQRRQCQNLCVIDGIENSMMCLNYCLSFPSDTSVCPPPATVAAIVQERTYTAPPTAAPTAAPTVHCLAPEVFKENMAFCDATMCSPYMWQVAELSQTSSSAQTKGTAADICMSMCSGLTLGPLRYDDNNTVIASPQRAMCRARCRAEGQRGSFLCQSYCRDAPLDPICALPDCKTLASMEANLEECDHNYCSALYGPKDYTRLGLGSLKDEIDLCQLPCSAQRLGGLDDSNTYEATLPMRKRCQARCSLEGVDESVMCLSYCRSFPTDPVCPDPAVVAQVANTTLNAPDCYIPDVFAQNMEVCEKQLCEPLNWVEGLVQSNATSDATAYDVCASACSVEALGTLSSPNTTLSTALEEKRGYCRDRCLLGGLESFLCRRYCEDFPSDLVCPKPDCKTFDSIEANPEYCDRSVCLKFLPWDPFLPVSQTELQQENICNLACSAQRLGPAGGLDTSVMRGHCQRLCTLSGPEGSLLCLSYCLSFPDDPVCPSLSIVQDLMTRSKPPTPSPTPPVYKRPDNFHAPLLMNVFATNSSINPVININQLTLGYNPFLGLEPHEQLGIYTRNEIFQFHLDKEGVFLVQAPNPNLQANTVAKFAAPLEYYVTPVLADCSYSSEESNTVTKSRDEYMRKVSSSKSMGGEAQPGGKLTQAGATSKTGDITNPVAGLPGLGKEISPSIQVSCKVGNSKESKIGRNYETQGMTQSMTTRLKRSYYKAGLRLDRFNEDSFTPAFRSDARELGNRPYNFNTTMKFVTKYGAYIFDAATMGASLYRSFFFDEDSTDTDISKAAESTKFTDVSALVTSQSSRGSSVDEAQTDGSKLSFSYTDVERIGEFNTGGPSSDATTNVNSCAIGASISPQVIEYELKPLWDPEIPLELFMPKGEADNFREYLYNATNAQLANGTSCADQFGGDCYGNGGSCIPKYNPESGVYNFQCENPRRAGKVGDWEYDVYVIGLEVAQYFNSQDGYPKWWGHHTENLPTSPSYYYPGKLPTQHGIFGYNQVKVSQDQTDLGTYCPLTEPNFWTEFDYQIRNKTKPDGSPNGYPVCEPNVKNKFTIRPSLDKPANVKIELASVNTRGITFGNYWHNFRVKDVNVRNELPESLITNHKQTVYYYAQPSMGVVVCPATFAENGTRIVNDDCYYVYKWVGSWKRDPETIDKSDADPITKKFAFVAQLFDVDIELERLASGEQLFFDNPHSNLYPVKIEAEQDMTFVTLTFDLSRITSQPVNVKANPPVAGRAGIYNSPVPERVGFQTTIKFSELQAKLNQGLDVFL